MTSTRARLIDAATNLVRRGGPEAVTLREVGRLAGVSHNAPYNHFRDKTDLLAYVAALELRRAVRGARRSTTSGLPLVRFMVEGLVRRAMAEPHLFFLTYGPWASANSELIASGSAAHELIVTAVADAQSTGEMSPGSPERVAALLLAVAQGAVDRSLAGHLIPRGMDRATPLDIVGEAFALLTPASGE